jgi:hypothetical protein
MVKSAGKSKVLRRAPAVCIFAPKVVVCGFAPCARVPRFARIQLEFLREKNE